MAGGIFLIQTDGGLVEMTEQAYDSEALLQSMLESYPSLLAGDQMDSVAPRRWLLISREVRLASEPEGASRWSVDHVFLNQDAVPTLVEVKRSSDTRIRREVVGQMLDYAANAIVYWPVEKMQAQFEQACASRQRDGEEVLLGFLGGEAEPDQFWQQAKTNLQAGRVRLIFVADRIPSELRRIVEFLNSQMDPAEVLAVEIRQFVGQGATAMVPRVMGQTAEAQQKNPGVPRNYDGTLPLDEVLKECRRRGDGIQIGHTGGESDLRRRDLEWLRNKEWKWRDPQTNRGTALPRNWIPGTRFLELTRNVIPPSDPGGRDHGSPGVDTDI